MSQNQHSPKKSTVREILIEMAKPITMSTEKERRQRAFAENIKAKAGANKRRQG